MPAESPMRRRLLPTTTIAITVGLAAAVTPAAAAPTASTRHDVKAHDHTARTAMAEPSAPPATVVAERELLALFPARDGAVAVLSEVDSPFRGMTALVAPDGTTSTTLDVRDEVLRVDRDGLHAVVGRFVSSNARSYRRVRLADGVTVGPSVEHSTSGSQEPVTVAADGLALLVRDGDGIVEVDLADAEVRRRDDVDDAGARFVVLHDDGAVTVADEGELRTTTGVPAEAAQEPAQPRPGHDEPEGECPVGGCYTQEPDTGTSCEEHGMCDEPTGSEPAARRASSSGVDLAATTGTWHDDATVVVARDGTLRRHDLRTGADLGVLARPTVADLPPHLASRPFTPTLVAVDGDTTAWTDDGVDGLVLLRDEVSRAVTVLDLAGWDGVVDGPLHDGGGIWLRDGQRLALHVGAVGDSPRLEVSPLDEAMEHGQREVVRGRLVDAGGRGLAGVEVAVVTSRRDDRATLRTDADGRFALTNVARLAEEYLQLHAVVDGRPAVSTLRYTVDHRRSTFVDRLELGPAGDAVGHSLAISRMRFADDGASWVLVGRDDVFADSLAASPLVADGPLLHTPSQDLDPRTLAELERVLAPGGTVYLLGGPAAVGDRVDAAIRARGYTIERLFGDDRVATSVAIAAEVVERYGDRGAVAVARAWGTPEDPNGSRAWADSVSGGGLAASAGIPVLVTRTSTLDRGVDAWLRARGTEVTVLLGGPAALSPAIEDRVPGPLRLAGDDRAGTAAAVAALFVDEQGRPSQRHVVLNLRDEHGWVWGLAAAGLSSDLFAPLLAGRPDVVPSATRTFLDDRGSWSDVYLLGDAALVGDELAARYDQR